MRINRLVAIAIALVVAASRLAAQHGGGGSSAGPAQVKRGNVLVDDLDLHMFLADLRSAAAPRVMNGYLALSAEGPYRIVSAAFEHEGYATLHHFDLNKHGVFVLAFAVPLARRESLRYRLVIDGAWTIDTSNPRSALDRATGIESSVADIPYLDDRKLGSYEILAKDGSTARFLFRAESGRTVTVYGDFDNWDPFIHELAETEIGVYTLELPLAPGIHRYAFVYGGEVLPDPLNPRREKDAEGKVVSVLVVGAGASSPH